MLLKLTKLHETLLRNSAYSLVSSALIETATRLSTTDTCNKGSVDAVYIYSASQLLDSKDSVHETANAHWRQNKMHVSHRSISIILDGVQLSTTTRLSAGEVKLFDFKKAYILVLYYMISSKKTIWVEFGRAYLWEIHVLDFSI